MFLQNGFSDEFLNRKKTTLKKIFCRLPNSGILKIIPNLLCNRYAFLLTNTLFNYLGLDPSGYRASIAHKDENDALLGGETQMSDEERFKVHFVFVYFISRVSVR